MTFSYLLSYHPTDIKEIHCVSVYYLNADFLDLYIYVY